MWLEDDSVYMYTRAVDHLFVCILYCTDEVLHTYFVLHTQQHYVEGLCLNHQNLRLLLAALRLSRLFAYLRHTLKSASRLARRSIVQRVFATW